MSRLSLSRRGFLHLTGGAASLAMWPASVWSASVRSAGTRSALVTTSSGLAGSPGATTSAYAHFPSVCRINALLPALQTVATRAGGDLGVSVIDLAGGASCAVRGDESFPLPSMMLMVAASVAERIEQGVFRQHTASAETLLDAMLAHNDAAACDALMVLLGGPRVIDADLRRWAVSGMRPDRSTPNAYADFVRRLVSGSLLGAQATAIVMRHWQRNVPAHNAITNGINNGITDGITTGLGQGWAVASPGGTGSTVAGRITTTHHAVLATSPAGRPLVVVAFLLDATGSEAEQAAVLSEVGRATNRACTTV